MHPPRLTSPPPGIEYKDQPCLFILYIISFILWPDETDSSPLDLLKINIFLKYDKSTIILLVLKIVSNQLNPEPIGKIFFLFFLQN